MSLNTWLNDVFEAGPSSGPRYDELQGVWEAYLANDNARIDDPRDDTAPPQDLWALPDDFEGNEQLIPSLPSDLLDLIGDDDQEGANDVTSHHDAAAAVSEGAAWSHGSGMSLHDRLKLHLPISSAFSSLIGLLSTKRPGEEIQSELVEILGFEGDGLSLVEEVLQPGARDRVVAESGLIASKNGAGSGHASEANTPHEQGTNANGNKYLPSSRLMVNAHKGKQKKKAIDITEMIGSSEDIARRIEEQLERPKAMFADEGRRVIEKEALPHVYTSTSASASMSMGGRFAMPQGTTREYADTYEEVIVPPSKPIPPRISERAIRINELSPVAKGCFPNYATLNRMQSIVQPIAMNTNENMLVCAPTGAGKTDVAIMSIIRVLAAHITSPPTSRTIEVDRDAFKVIYVAPMKALAAEITRKFGKRLAWLGIKVRELTGDMQLTRQEIADTQIIVTTPEKWDVVTRKPTGEGELASKVKLLIIDEVHLLNEDRGAVIETIVARTLRQVESSQSLIRIVGLSATLPNYRDVSDFLRVNPYQGLFFFDASFRPVPLEQHFIGVTGKARSPQQTRNLDKVVFDKVAEMVQDGHQVMVFVHARKETVKSAQKIKEMSMEEGMTTFFEATDHPKFQFYRKEISQSRNKEMKELFDAGFGIHHAGMLRSDRNMMEKMFEDQAIKVLVCTSTLAWGVNLPAHAVVIKGTQVYDSSKGAFQDLSVLDVLQIFGRAGRPGYETSGVGYICTSHDKLDHYLYSIMSQHPIESKFIAGTVDSLNAEIALGTIGNVQEAIQWLGYTYLFVRMRKEPMVYGMSHDEPKDDPQLGNKRNELIVQAARQLSTAKMIRYDEINNSFAISDLGRIAAKYYLKYQTIEIFNTLFNPKMKNADLFAMLAQATEFDQIQVRENELDELTAILESDHCPMEVKGGVTSKHGKVNILLQAHISKVFIEDFALVSDSAYVAQNAARIIRALLEIALSRNWANNAILLIDLSKAIEKRMWPYEHPLSQITTLHRDTLHNLKQWADDTEIAELRDMSPAEIGQRIKMNDQHGTAVHNAARMFPTVGVEYALRPLSHNVLQLSVKVVPQFEWNGKISTSAEPFYVWIQDETGLNILQWRHLLIRQSTTAMNIDFLLNLGEAPPNSVTIVSASDRWLGSDTTAVIPLADLVMPSVPPESTEILEIPYLKISVLGNQSLEDSYRRYVHMLNGIQSQAFWPVYHTQNNVLISAPVASGKSLLGEMAIWHAFKHDPQAKVLVLAPTRDAVADVCARLDSIVPKSMGVRVKRCSKGSDIAGLAKATIAVADATALLHLEPAQLAKILPYFALFLLEDLHMMDELYELAITAVLSVARPCKTRIVGLATTLNDPHDLAEWLGVEDNSRFSFYPVDRGNPITVSVKSFTIAHSATLLKVMVKPAYDVIKSARGAGVIVFVPSRVAARTVAADMVTQSGTEMDLNGFLGAPRADVEPLIQSKGLKDVSLYEPLLHGIGYVINTMAPQDFALVLELFASGILKALIAPREACWTLPVRASTVVVMGAQYVKTTSTSESGKRTEVDRQVVDYSRTELVRMQGFAVMSAGPGGNNTVNGEAGGGGGRMFVMCQTEQAPSISRILADGLPLESNLPALLSKDRSAVSSASIAALDRLLSAKPRDPPPRPQINRPRVPDGRKNDMMDLLNWTYLAKRTRSNPTYYALHKGYEVDGVSRLVDKWFEGNEWRDEARDRVDGQDARDEAKGNEKGKDKREKGESATAEVVSEGSGAGKEEQANGTGEK